MAEEAKDIVLTDEMRAALAGSLGFRVEETFAYTPRAYRVKRADETYIVPKAAWPVFTLRGVDGVSATLAEDKLHGTVKMGEDGSRSITISSGRHKVDTCCRGIVTWRNFRDDKGRLISPPEPDTINGGVMESALRVLSPALISELANAIIERSVLTAEEMLGLE